MSNRVVVFTGPTLSVVEAQKVLEATYLPPAKQGDIYKAFIKYRPKVIGLIDGNFENIPSPWHKEILYIMSQGVSVLGASSMGALRAAELADFGMIGVGQIFRNFYSNELEDDDEVTVVHGPKELDYPLLSEAMVNIRETFKSALKNKVISDNLFVFGLRVAKDLPYKERNYPCIISLLRNSNRFTKNEIDELDNWCEFNAEDIKQKDAIELLQNIKIFVTNATNQPENNIHFQNTVYWQQMKNEIDTEYNLRKDA